MSEIPQKVDYKDILPKDASIRVDGVIDGIRQMGENNSWFVIRTPDELQEIIPQIQAATDTYKKSLEPFGEVRMFLNSPSSPVDDLLSVAAKAAGRSEGADLAGEAASSEAGEASSKVAQFAAIGEIRTEPYTITSLALTSADYDVIGAMFVASQAAVWESLADLPELSDKANPGLALLELYALGAASTGFLSVDGEKQFTVDFPLLLPENQRGLGFWVDGDAQVILQKGWASPYESLRPLIGALPIRRKIELLPMRQSSYLVVPPPIT